jgi:hypothetical protein
MYSRKRTDDRRDAGHSLKANHSYLRGFSILHLGTARKNTTFREVDEAHSLSGFCETLSGGE